MDNEARGKVAKQTVLGSSDAKVVEEVFTDSGVSWQSFLSSRLRLLKLPSEILDSIRESKLQYTKALEVAKVKDSEIRQRLLEEATSENLSISDIKLRIRETNTNNLKEQNVTSRLNEAYKRIRNSKALENPKNLKVLQKIIEQMEMLSEEN
jgi:ParB family chromosome partitioning protein